MALTADQIASELASSISQTDNTIDTTRGPVPSLYIRPQSGQLATVAQTAEDLQQLFTLQFPSAITPAQATQALGNYGSAPGLGTNSQVVQYFMRFTRPITDITIPSGTLVSNVDGSLVYQTLTTITMTASAASTYYNAGRNAYEVSVLVQALGTGDQYELAPLLINTILTPIPGVDATENRVKAVGGTPSETVDSQTARLQTALQGLNYGAPGGISSRLMNQFAGIITDVSVIQPFQPEFTRLIAGSAIDVYLIGSQISTFTQSYVATSGQRQIPLTNVPAVAINSVTVNGIGVSDYDLVADTTPETGYSLDATDVVAFSTPFANGDQVVIQYNYNSLLQNVDTNYFGVTEQTLFNVDTLIRSPFPVSPIISMIVRVLPSYDADAIEQTLTSFLTTTFTPTTFTSVVYPEILRQTIQSTIAGIQSIIITVFHRDSGALAQVEPIYLTANENLVYDGTLVTLQVS